MDDEGANDAMHEMMGFSSFGSNKRQKLNVNNDSSQRRPVATSSNNTPLGTRQDPNNMNAKFRMVPASLPPSGRSSKSPTPEPPHRPPQTPSEPLPLPVRQQPIAEVQGHGQGETQIGTITTPVATSTLDTPDMSGETQPQAAQKSIYSANDIRSDPTYATMTSTRDTNSSDRHGQNARSKSNSYFTSKADKDADDDEIAYTSPAGAQMTRKELNEYSRGKEVIKEDGTKDVVFFKPGFIDENPWARLERERGVVRS